MTSRLTSFNRYRAAGCFQPDEIEALERAYAGTMAQILRHPDIAARADGDAFRERVAACIVRSAKHGPLEPARIEAEVLALIASPPDGEARTG
jgi:hypothetical protein